jgi:YrbI family 3-deoxy-D-manno-octulosonate 8-phosphate phosphatase
MGDRKRLAKKAKLIRMLLLDVDGVMTDGGVYYSADGVEMKRFNAHDGYGIVLARENGLKIGIISGRTTPLVEARMKDLNVDEVIQGSTDKVSALREIQKRHSLTDEEIAFMGDDLFDLPLLHVVGLSAAPRNARREVKDSVDYVAKADGGNGAVREFVEIILRYQLV